MKSKKRSHRAARREVTSGLESLVLLRVRLGARPASKHESDLVDEVSNVVDNVESHLIGGAAQDSEEVAQRVDAPASRDNQAHVVERLLDGIRHGSIIASIVRLACEDPC